MDAPQKDRVGAIAAELGRLGRRLDELGGDLRALHPDPPQAPEPPRVSEPPRVPQYPGGPYAGPAQFGGQYAGPYPPVPVWPGAP